MIDPARMMARRLTLPLALGLALAAAAGAALWSTGRGTSEAPATFAFQPSTQRIPGSLVRSQSVRLEGLDGAVEVSIGGAAEQLLVNGKPAAAAPGGDGVQVGPGDRIALAVRAPAGYGETAVGTVRAGDRGAEFRVTSLRKAPPDGLVFGEAEAAPGRNASSAVVAPAGFAPGSPLLVDGAGVRVETREGRFDPPVTLAPGEPFRLVARVPEGASEPLEVAVELGELRGVWRVRVR